MLEACNNVRKTLGSWQFRKHKDRECQIKSLVKEIGELMDAQGNVEDADRLPIARGSW